MCLLASNENKHAQCGPEESKLRVQVCFAESDVLIGGQGQAYFQGCWQEDLIAAAIDVESKVLPGTDHCNVLSHVARGVLKHVFKAVAGPCNEEA